MLRRNKIDCYVLCWLACIFDFINIYMYSKQEAFRERQSPARLVVWGVWNSLAKADLINDENPASRWISATLNIITMFSFHFRPILKNTPAIRLSQHYKQEHYTHTHDETEWNIYMKTFARFRRSFAISPQNDKNDHLKHSTYIKRLLGLGIMWHR